MKVLITGGAGFIGSHLAEEFQGRAEVRVLDDLSSGKRANLEGFDVEFIEGSILDPDTVRRAVAGVDLVFHLAAMISVPESVERPHACVARNVTGLLNVLEASADAGVRKLCFSSSAAVYGNDPELPKRESMRPSPESPYGITKLSGEYYCRMFAIQGRLCTACLRYFNVYGPRQDPASQYAAAIPHFIARALAGEPLTIFGDGLQTRDFVFVKDVVAANIHCALHEDLDSVYNVACGTRISVNQLAETIVRACGSGSEIRYAAERPGDVKHSVACVDRLAEAGFRARTPLVEGLGATVAYFRDLTSPARGC